MSNSPAPINPNDARFKHTQRIKLGIIIICSPWMFLGFIGLISAGVTMAKAARVPLDEIRPLALATLAICALTSIAGLAVLILGIAGHLKSAKPSGNTL